VHVDQLIQDSIAHLNSSPARALRTTHKKLNLKLDHAQFDRLSEQLHTYREKLKKPLHIVLMGEVKAGKSTVLNCLAQGKVAPTDVLEATAVISIVRHGAPEAAIYYKHGEKDVGAPEDVFSVLQARQQDPEFAESVDTVRMSLELAGLEDLVVVDTPGLATMTHANANRTRDFAKEADVVVWVFNANHLGQSDVNDELEQVAMLGKPVIAIINRIDEVDGERHRLVKYIKRELGHLLSEAFPLSAKQGYESIMARDQDGIDASGFTAFISYLRDKIQADRDRVHLMSILQSTAATVRHDALLHGSVLRSLEHLMDQSNVNRLTVEHERQRIETALLSEVRGAASRFLVEQEEDFMARIEQGGFFSSLARDSYQEELVKNINEWSRLFWEQELANISKYHASQWHGAIENIASEVAQFSNSFNSREAEHLAALVRETHGKDAMIAGAGQGALAASVGGVGLAFYAAALGPAASVVTMGPALAAFVPPLAIAGAVAGIATRFFNTRQKKDTLRLDLRQAFQRIRDDCRERHVENMLVPMLSKWCHETAQKIAYDFDNEMYGDYSYAEIELLIGNMKKHIAESEVLSNALLRGLQ